MTESQATPASETPAAPTPRRRWRRRLLIAGLVLVALFLLAPLLLSLPPVRSKIADTIGAKLDRKVEIGSASAYWFRGIDLEDITVHSPDGFDGPLATVQKIHADVDVLGALFGTMKASVRVIQPHVTFRRNAAGASNTDGIAEHMRTDDDEEDGGEGGGSDIQLAVIGGTVESIGATGTADAALRELDIGLTLDPAGDLGIEVRGVASGAGVDGGGARIHANVTRRPDGSLPFAVDVPSLNLAGLAALIRDTTGIEDAQGQIEIVGEGERTAAGTYDGTFNAQAAGLRARLPDGVMISLGRLQAAATMRTIEAATDLDANMRLGDLRIDDPAEGTRQYRDPAITMSTKARIHPEGWIRIAEAHLDAGRTASIAMPDVFKLQLDPTLRFDGRLEIAADLGRVGALRALVPALDPLGGGQLEAQVRGTGDQGLEVGLGATITGLSLRPGATFPQGYLEPDVRLTAGLTQTPDGGTTVRLLRVASRLLQLDAADASEGVAFGIDADERFWLDGGFSGRVDLASLTRLLAAQMPLEPGEQVGGTLTFRGTGRGQGDSMQLDTHLAMHGVTVPPSWSAARTPTNLKARLGAQRVRGNTTVQLSDLDGMGLGGELVARLREADGERFLEDVEGQLSLDLGAARPWLGALAGLEREARLAGVARSRLRLAEDGAGRRLDATVQVSNLVFQATPTSARLDEPRVTLRADAWLAPEGGRHKAEECKLTATGLTIDASGSTYVAAPDEDLDVSLQIAGDAARLAPTIAALLGEGYEDLTGEGRLGGSVTLTGSTADHARDLRVEGDLLLASWSTSGIEIGDLKATLARAKPAEPLSIGMTSTLNKGRFFSQGAVTLGTEDLPWQGHVDMTDVDTSGVVTSRGIGRLLAFALPALLPSQASVPVLSGRLTARVEAEAPTVADPGMLDGLTGRGRVSMAQGEIRNSTLFGGAGGDSGVARLIQGLKVAIPEAGRVLERATKALTFSALESKFRVAQRVVHVDRALLTGQALDVDMRGTVQFDKRIALDSKLVLKGRDAERLSKVLAGGAIPMRIGGTLAAPQVRPNVDMAKLLAGAVGDPKDLLDRLKKDGLPRIKNPFK